MPTHEAAAISETHGDFVIGDGISAHARRRARERGVTMSAVIRGTASAGAIVSDGVVCTVVPPAWAAGAGQMRRAAERRRRLERRRDARVPIPEYAVAHVVGKNGCRIKALQETTGARVWIDRGDAVVRGDAASSERAIGELQRIVRATTERRNAAFVKLNAPTGPGRRG